VKKRKLKVRKRDREINRDISVMTDILLIKLDRIEGQLANLQAEPEQAIIVNINSQRQGR
jgi:hypothetical protein